jgi:hypothetical protein
MNLTMNPKSFIRKCCAWSIGVLFLAGCGTPSFDISDRSIKPPGPDYGLVIGSVLVEADSEPPNSWLNTVFGRKAAGFTYDFEIVRTGTIDGTIISGDTERYELDVKPKEERLFVARLPVGTYRIKTFRHEGFSAMGGELRICFTVTPKMTKYIGRLVLDVPRRVTLGSPFTYRIDDAHDTTLDKIREQHPDLGPDVVIAPMLAK